MTSIFRWRLSRKRFSAENARTVTMPSRSSPKSEKIGDLVFDSMRRRSRPVFKYPIANSRYAIPMKVAGTRNQGNTKLSIDGSKFINNRKTTTHATVRTEAKKLAKERFTACREPANDVSIVSISLVQALKRYK